MNGTAVEPPRAAATPPGEAHRTAPRLARSKPLPALWKRLAWQALILAAFLAIWQWGPTSDFLSAHFRFLNRFDVSSPTAVAKEISQLARGTDGVPLVWPYLAKTVEATLAGLAIGMVLGTLVGLLLSELPAVNSVLRPFILLINSAPRVALIPIVVLLVGPTIGASIISSVLIVFFLGFFNAYEGASSVPEAMLDNAWMLGARPRHRLLTLRLPQALVWAFGVLPNAISFSLVTVVTTELLTGVAGMGQLILSATSQLDAALSLALVVLLSIVGALLVFVTTVARTRVLRWETTRHTP
jgi:NitT/TauT family transport system permease protein